ncbi:MAG: DUF1820 family protein [Gammaproteobacteria bacterium AqS3]|nr:DUF1820 family protein [Gammaproteobacteria bacterium AqS3]
MSGKKRAGATVYRVWLNDEEQPIYAFKFVRSDVLGFVELEDFAFAEEGSVIVNPSEEKLRNELKGVRRTYIPFGRIARIDEVSSDEVIGHQGESVVMFPVPPKRPTKGRREKAPDGEEP